MPADVLEQSCKRVGILGMVFAGLWVTALLMGTVAHQFFRQHMPIHEPAWPMPGTVIGIIGLGLSLGLVLLAGRLRERPNLLLDISLAFQVVTALLIGIMNQWVPDFTNGGVSWICVVILAFPAIAPNTPGKTLVASFLAASMDPLGLAVAEIRGVQYEATTLTVGWSFISNYVCALIAVVPAHIIRGLGRQARRARDLGSYKLGEELGRGGMGAVYRAEHRLLARQAAIKLIRPEMLGASSPDAAHVMVERFKREAQAAATLRSPHTIELYDFGETEDGAFYYVMELLHGLSLEELVERFGPVPAERAMYLMRQVCLSLAEAHENGLIHRDVKPSNIFASRMGMQVDYVKVLDFGLVKAREDREQSLLTQQGMTTGTPAYMAPELALADADLDGRADLYAVGCVFYWLLTGQLVFEADSPLRVMHRHVSDTPEPPSRRTEIPIPSELETLILDCLAKDPGQRPPNAIALVTRLDRVAVGEPWSDRRAWQWWMTHFPETAPVGVCDKGELAPAMETP
jgi:serine/threonine-protein kinase